ncbi:MCT1A protease, partial [Lanius ludovicianus]|nr:MCT1A protease [Lanius ludovicianus]
LLLTSAFVLQPGAGAGKIVGGWQVKPHSRPYMAYLKIKAGSQTKSCGGFLIRPDAVLSAAHCVDEEGPMKVTVILGAHNISDRELSQQKIRVRHWVIHPKYSRTGFKNDIVLLKLKPKARITEYVQPLSLARSNENVRAGAICKVSGWGRTLMTELRTNVMREVKLKVQNEEKCQQFRNYQRQSMICVGDAYGKKATHKGDSGGTLVCDEKAHGIVSYGPKRHLFPKVFTRISYFEPWIREQLGMFDI